MRFLPKFNFGKENTIVKLIKYHLSAVKLPLDDKSNKSKYRQQSTAPPKTLNIHSEIRGL